MLRFWLGVVALWAALVLVPARCGTAVVDVERIGYLAWLALGFWVVSMLWSIVMGLRL